MTWKVRVYWRSGGNLWETGGDVDFPDGTTWDQAVSEVIRMRGSGAHRIIRVEAEVGEDDV